MATHMAPFGFPPSLVFPCAGAEQAGNCYNQHNAHHGPLRWRPRLCASAGGKLPWPGENRVSEGWARTCPKRNGIKAIAWCILSLVRFLGWSRVFVRVTVEGGGGRVGRLGAVRAEPVPFPAISLWSASIGPVNSILVMLLS